MASELEILLAEKRRRDELQSLLAEKQRRQQVLQQAQPRGPTGVPPAIAANTGLQPGSQPGGQESQGGFGSALRQLFPVISAGVEKAAPAVSQAAQQIPAELGQAAVQELQQPGTQEFLATSTGEQIGRTGGAAAGAAVAGPPGAAVGAVFGGALGAATSFTLTKLAQGKEVKKGEFAWEFGLSALPDALVKPLGIAARKVGSLGKAGLKAGENVAGRFIQRRSFEAFESPGADVVGVLFENVRKSGALLDPKQFAKPLNNLGNKAWKDVRRVLNNIPAPPGKEAEGFGEGIVEIFEKIRRGEEVPGADLGVLQHVSSQLKKAATGKKDSAVVDALVSTGKILDDGIATGRFLRGGEQGPLLLNARAQWRKFKEAEEFTNLVRSRAITSSTKGGKRVKFNFGKLKDAIEDPQTRQEIIAAAALNNNPQVKKEMLEFIENMKTFDIEGTELGVIQSVVDSISLILPNAAARARFNSIVRGNNGVIAETQLILLGNAVRRSVFGTGQPLSSGEETGPL